MRRLEHETGSIPAGDVQLTKLVDFQYKKNRHWYCEEEDAWQNVDDEIHEANLFK